MCAHSCTSYMLGNCLGQMGNKLPYIVLGKLYSFVVWWCVHGFGDSKKSNPNFSSSIHKYDVFDFLIESYNYE